MPFGDTAMALGVVMGEIAPQMNISMPAKP